MCIFQKNNFFILLICVAITACNQKASEQFSVPNTAILKQRILPPEGFKRATQPRDSWGEFLENLPLQPEGSEVIQYNGVPISNQNSHIAIINYDVGKRNLQQCADAVLRLRAEYLWKTDRKAEIEFKFTSGHNFKWLDYAQGVRPIVSGNKVKFKKTASENHSYQSFRKYLDIIFMYAGTISVERDLKTVNRAQGNYQIGDVIVKGGSPGHAVIIVDRAKNSQGKFVYLLAQSYMPAQSIHVMDQGGTYGPWFDIPTEGAFHSSRWYFTNPKIRRF